MPFNPEIHRRRSVRLRGFDYSRVGFYFVTICTRNKESLFGMIVNQKMALSAMGRIVEKYWRNIPGHFSHVKLDEFCIMPNHIHGILIIAYTPDKGIQNNIEKEWHGSDKDEKKDTIARRGSIRDLKIQLNPDISKNIQMLGFNTKKQNHIEPLPQETFQTHAYQHIIPESIGSIIRTYKTAVTKRCRDNGFHHFFWQRNFYDRVIRCEKELQNIREYIKNNPSQWDTDEENPINQ